MKMLTGLLSYICVGLFVYFAIMKGTSNASLFLNVHGLVLVVGGICVAGLASFPWTLLWSCVRVVVSQLNTKSKIGKLTCEQAVKVAVVYQRGPAQLEKMIPEIEHPFLADAANLMCEGLEKDFVLDILEKRLEEQRNGIMSQMNVLLTLSKYSPAMGLAATVLGLVDLLSKLAKADLGELGFGMAIALTSTFFGIILSNLFFAPMAELISSAGEIEMREHELIRDAVEAALDRKNPVVVGELVNSYLPVSERLKVSETLRDLGSESRAA